MAVFLINVCKFNGCGITFPSLGDLIKHIEETHIDYDPLVIEQKELSRPQCIPLSYALRFITDAAKKDRFFDTEVEFQRKLAIKHHSYSISSHRSTPTGSEIDDEEIIMSETEDSNESWTTEEFSSEFIMKYGSRHTGSTNGSNSSIDKPFACPVPGCKKRYKNVNGIKYHSKNGHKKDGKIRKGYKCHCGKSYKTSQGLKTHSITAHNISSDTTTTATLQVTPSSLIGSDDRSCNNDLSTSTCNINNNINNNNNVSKTSFVTNNNNNTFNKNFGFIAIKTKSTNNNDSTTTNKLLKVIRENDKQNLNSGLVNNLGLITPATSPKLNSQQLQNNINNNIENNLPLTPTSPDKTSKTILIEDT